MYEKDKEMFKSENRSCGADLRVFFFFHLVAIAMYSLNAAYCLNRKYSGITTAKANTKVKIAIQTKNLVAVDSFSFNPAYIRSHICLNSVSRIIAASLRAVVLADARKVPHCGQGTFSLHLASSIGLWHLGQFIVRLLFRAATLTCKPTFAALKEKGRSPKSCPVRQTDPAGTEVPTSLGQDFVYRDGYYSILIEIHYGETINCRASNFDFLGWSIFQDA